MKEFLIAFGNLNILEVIFVSSIYFLITKGCQYLVSKIEDFFKR